MFFEQMFLFSSVLKTEIHTAIGAAAVLAPQAVSPDVAHYRFSFFIIVFLFSHMVIHKLSVIWGDGGVAIANVCVDFLADIFGSSEGTDVFGKEAIKSQS